jgi:hypothetical protein
MSARWWIPPLVAGCLQGSCGRDRQAEAPPAPPPSLSPQDAQPTEPPGPPFTIEVDEGPDPADGLLAPVSITDRPAGERSRARYARNADRRWLRFRVRAAAGVDVAVDGAAPAPTDDSEPGAFRVDLFEPLKDAPPHVLSVASLPAGVTRHQIDVGVRVADPSGVARGRLSIEIPAEPEADMRQRLYRVPREPLDWAAPYTPDGTPRPVILVQTGAGTGHSVGESVGSPSVSVDLRFLPPFARVRDVELVAIETIRSAVIGRCPVCADLGGFLDDPSCERTRYTHDVAVYAARTGERIARRRFPGPMPGPCAPRGETTDPFAVLGEMPLEETAAWVATIASRAPGAPR